MKNTCFLHEKVIQYCLRSKEKERGTTLREFYGGIFIDKETLLASGIEYPIKSLNISGSHPGNVANFYGKISQKHHNLYARLQEGK